MISKTVCELFAGVGGFRVGLESSSKEWKTVWANQWEPGKKLQHAFNCYCHHFGHNTNHVNENISTLDKTTIPDHNLLVGGFPCQDYSVARTKAQGISGIKGVLWWDIFNILEEKHPKFVLLENVDRLLKSPGKQKGRDFGVILSCFYQLGYTVEWRVINAADYGFAQRRKRVFIFAYKHNTSYHNHMITHIPQDIVENSGFFAKTFPLSKTEAYRDTCIQQMDAVDISNRFAFDFGNSGHMINGNILTCNSLPKNHAPILLKSLLEHDVQKNYYLGENLSKWTYLKGAKKIERVSKEGHAYTFSEGAIAFPDPIDKPARTMLTSESCINRSTHVIEDPTTQKLRLLTPVEAERIQGFRDNWTNTGMPERFRYFCMGNALVVGLVEKMGHQLNDIFEKENDPA